MARNAARGLELREKHGRGGTAIGVARARDISNRKNLSPETVKRMHSYFARHEVDKQGEGWGKDSAGYIAWLLWGGDAGKTWAKRKVDQMNNKEDNGMSDIKKEIAARLGVFARPAKVEFADEGGEVSISGSEVRIGDKAYKIVKSRKLEQLSEGEQQRVKSVGRSHWIANYDIRGPKGGSASLDVYSNGAFILTQVYGAGRVKTMRGLLHNSRPGAKSRNAIREGEKISAGTNFKNAQDELEWIASAIEYAYDTITNGNSENDRKTLARIELLKKRAKQLSLDMKRRGEI